MVIGNVRVSKEVFFPKGVYGICGAINHNVENSNETGWKWVAIENVCCQYAKFMNNRLKLFKQKEKKILAGLSCVSI